MRSVSRDQTFAIGDETVLLRQAPLARTLSEVTLGRTNPPDPRLGCADTPVPLGDCRAARGQLAGGGTGLDDHPFRERLLRYRTAAVSLRVGLHRQRDIAVCAFPAEPDGGAATPCSPPSSRAGYRDRPQRCWWLDGIADAGAACGTGWHRSLRQ